MTIIIISERHKIKHRIYALQLLTESDNMKDKQIHLIAINDLRKALNE